MATPYSDTDTFTRLYRDRIGEPTTGDEVSGYWIFALGLVLGVAGILLFLMSSTATPFREAAIVVVATGLALLLAGPLVRLPLQRAATGLVYAGLAVAAAGIVYFVVVYPAGWSPFSGHAGVMLVYALGLLIVTIGGVVVPMLTTDTAQTTRTRTRRRERDADDEEPAVPDADDVMTARMLDLRTSQARFELYEDQGGKHRWRLRHRNGNVLADGGQGYSRRHDAHRGLNSVRRNAPRAELLLISDEDQLPPAEATFQPPDERDSEATFEVYEDEGGKHRWRLLHDNGNILADGGQGYASRAGVREAVDRVQTLAGPADYLRPDPTAFEVYIDRAGEWRWRLVHENGQVLADSGEGYSRRHDAKRAVDRVQERVDDLDFEVYEDDAGEHRWRLLAGRDRIVADSGEGYASRDGAESAVKRVRDYAPEADTLVIGEATFEVYEDEGGKHRWRLRHRNGNITADSGQGYTDRTSAFDGIHSVKANAPSADVDTV